MSWIWLFRAQRMFEECSPECFTRFAEMFYNIPRNVWRHSLECLGTFPGMFEDIPRNFWRHSSEFFSTFPECLRTFLEMFEGILCNVCGHSPRYKIPSIPHVPRILFPVPVFLFLYIADVFLLKQYWLIMTDFDRWLIGKNKLQICETIKM